MTFRRAFFAIVCFCLLAACEKAPVQERLIMPDLTVAVAPFTQPRQTTDLLSGFIPEDQSTVAAGKLDGLDSIFQEKLNTQKNHRYIFLSKGSRPAEPALDSRGRKSALETWASQARNAGADMIIVPHLIDLRERVGSKAGVISAASVNMDIYLIDAREPATLLHRTHFSEEQKPLSSDITKISSFFRRGGGWVSADELAAEGMEKAVRELGL